MNSQVDVPCSAVCRDVYFAGLRLLVSTVSHLHMFVCWKDRGPPAPLYIDLRGNELI